MFDPEKVDRHDYETRIDYRPDYYVFAEDYDQLLELYKTVCEERDTYMKSFADVMLIDLKEFSE